MPDLGVCCPVLSLLHTALASLNGHCRWTQYRAPDTGEAYYHNGRTGETTWDKPAGWGP